MSMHALTVMRHAKSAYPAGVRDFDRPLSGRGRRNAREMAERLLALDSTPTAIRASAAARTTETTQSINTQLNLPAEAIDYLEELYLASTRTLGQHLQSAIDEGVEHLLIIGHNPGLESFCAELDLDAPEALKTAAFCHFVSDESADPIRWRLRCHETPTRR